MKNNYLWSLLLLFFVQINVAEAQLFTLDSVLVSLFKQDSLQNTLQKNANGKTIPILVSDNTFLKLFNLKDTIIDEFELFYFTSKEKIIEHYKLKANNDTYLYVHLSMFNVDRETVQIKFYYGIFVCDKRFFKKSKPIVFETNGYSLIEFKYLIQNSSITLKTIAW
ncbi:hypothetical protein DSECCO2_611100 [anaerobic digester metagenome]